MSVISTDAKRIKGELKFETFWRKIAEALDRLVINRSSRAIPATALRRARHDGYRCRRLMRQS